MKNMPNIKEIIKGSTMTKSLFGLLKVPKMKILTGFNFKGIKPVSLFMGTFFVIILIFLSACTSNSIEKKPPLAVEGVLDLRGWDFSKKVLVPLNGEWQFYWNQLLNPHDFKDSNLPEQNTHINLPGIWNGY